MRIHRNALANATDEQLRALRDNVLKDKWEHIPDDGVEVVLNSVINTLFVVLHDAEDRHIITLGIEKDGYTHS